MILFAIDDAQRILTEFYDFENVVAVRVVAASADKPHLDTALAGHY